MRSVGLTSCRVAVVLVGTLALNCANGVTTPPTTVIVVRHAEKHTLGEDPGLTSSGEVRSNRLRDLALDSDVTAIFATQYRRTQDTVRPLAEALGLEIEIVDARDLEGLASKILSEHRGGTVVVAGHSNTVPGIIAALGAPEPEPIDESQYGNLFIVTVPESGTSGALRIQF